MMRAVRKIRLIVGASIGLVLVCVLVWSKNYFGNQNNALSAPPSQAARIQISPLVPQYDFRDIAFVDNNQAWAIGYEGLYKPKLWYSSDGSFHWTERPIPDDQLLLHLIFFTDAKHGWAAGVFNNMYRTTDGGQSWQEIKVPIEGEIEALNFVNAEVGFVGGAITKKSIKEGNLQPGVEILCTINGGTDWKSCYKDNINAGVKRIVTFSETVAIAVLNVSSLIRTSDGGSTWQLVASGKWNFLDLTVSPDGIGWAVGWDGFYRSIDQGQTWHKVEDLPQNLQHIHWTSIDFADITYGIAVSDEGIIAITNDGGKTWAECSTRIDDRLWKIKVHGKKGIILGRDKAKAYIVNL